MSVQEGKTGSFPARCLAAPAPYGPSRLPRALHLQVSVVKEAAEKELFGWVMPGKEKFRLPAPRWAISSSASASFFHRYQRRRAGDGADRQPRAGDASDILPTILLRDLLAGDTDSAQALGCLELDEEDLALCTYVCPRKV